MFLVGGGDQKEFIEDYKGKFLKLLHYLLVFPLYPCRFQFAEQFRQADIPGFVSRLAGIDAQSIRNKAFAGTGCSDQDDIQSLADVIVICQAFQKIPVQMSVRQVIDVPKECR